MIRDARRRAKSGRESGCDESGGESDASGSERREPTDRFWLVKDFAFRHHDPDAKLALLARLWFFGILISRGPIRGAARAFQLASPDARREALEIWLAGRSRMGHSCRARDPHVLSRTPIAMASSAMAASASATYAGAALTHRRASVHATRGTTVVVRAAEEKFDARAFRRELSKSSKYNRKFEKDQESAEAMETAGIGMVSKGASARVTVREAISFGATCEIAPHRTSARPTISTVGPRPDRAPNLAIVRSPRLLSPPPPVPSSTQAVSCPRCAPRASSTSTVMSP